MALYNSHNGKPVRRQTRNIAVMVILVIFALATLFPIYFMFISSFGDPVEAGAMNYALFPTKISLDSYKFFFDYSEHSVQWLLNSLIVASAVMVSNVFFASLAGYAFSKIRFKGRTVLFSVLLVSMMIPYQVTQVPLYILIVNTFQIQNTYEAMIVPGLVTVYNIFWRSSLCQAFLQKSSSVPRLRDATSFRFISKSYCRYPKPFLPSWQSLPSWTVGIPSSGLSS